MDDPKFEKSIAMVILPWDGVELLTEAGSRDIFEDVYDEMEADLVADGELLLHYDKSEDVYKRQPASCGSASEERKHSGGGMFYQRSCR